MVQSQYEQLYRYCLNYADTLIADKSLPSGLKKDLIDQLKYADDFNNTYLTQLIPNKINLNQFSKLLDGFGHYATPKPVISSKTEDKEVIQSGNKSVDKQKPEAVTKITGGLLDGLDDEEDDFDLPELHKSEEDQGQIAPKDRESVPAQFEYPSNISSIKNRYETQLKSQVSGSSQDKNSLQNGRLNNQQETRQPLRSNLDIKRYQTQPINQQKVNKNQHQQLESLESMERSQHKELNPFKKIMGDEKPFNNMDKKAKLPLRREETPNLPQFNTDYNENPRETAKFKENGQHSKPPTQAQTQDISRKEDLAELQTEIKQLQLKLEQLNIKMEKQNYYLEDKDQEINFLRAQLENQVLESERLSDENDHLIKELEYLTQTIKKGSVEYNHAASNVQNKEIVSLQLKLEQEKKRSEAYKERLDIMHGQNSKNQIQLLNTNQIVQSKTEIYNSGTKVHYERQSVEKGFEAPKRSDFVQSMIDQVESDIKIQKNMREQPQNKMGHSKYKLDRDWLNFDVQSIIQTKSNLAAQKPSFLRNSKNIGEIQEKLKYDNMASYAFRPNEDHFSTSNAQMNYYDDNYEALRHLGVQRNSNNENLNDVKQILKFTTDHKNNNNDSPQMNLRSSQNNRNLTVKSNLGLAKSKYIDTINNLENQMMLNYSLKKSNHANSPDQDYQKKLYSSEVRVKKESPF